jgi:energy-coupling factor transporter ATP-binding protein EcfA2
MERLGRVNLLVGTNNSGKTSVLEAISMLMEQGSWEPLLRSLRRRGEAQYEQELDLAHLFHGHQVAPGATFKIEGGNESSNCRMEVLIRERDPETSHHYRPSRYDEDFMIGPSQLYLKWMRDGTEQEIDFPISKRGGATAFYDAHSMFNDRNTDVFFITTEALWREQVSSLLEAVMLTPEEDTLLTALRTIEPSIERIAPVGSGRMGSAASLHGGVAVKLAGQRVPIGSLGDGIWRLLGITLALVKVRGGVLLVDEIDTGLHYSVLEKMWRLVHETASRLDVQVFATTHSRDCYESLAAIARPTGHDVTIQRIERGKPLAIAFSEAEILQAAKRGIEVR